MGDHGAARGAGGTADQGAGAPAELVADGVAERAADTAAERGIQGVVVEGHRREAAHTGEQRGRGERVADRVPHVSLQCAW